MKRESPLSEYRAVRELTYAWLYYFLSLQYSFLGDPKNGINFRIQKTLWSEVFGELRRKFFGELLVRSRYIPRMINVTPEFGKDYTYLRKQTGVLEFSEEVVRREELETADQEIFDFLTQDWNRIYIQEREKASILGYVAEYLLGHGVKEDELKEMTLPEFSETAIAHNLPGLKDINLLQEEIGLTKEQTYSLLYAQGQGAQWLAIYNKNGERKGKVYELITKMYRRQIAEALSRNATEEEIRSLMISPDDDEIKEALGLFEVGISDSLRSRREKRYEKLVTDHLNRDMTRFAFTEVQINFNNGKLLYLANEKPSATYVRFAGGSYT
ncbi:hypothetical protein [Leptospira interrogans]|uniref:hypothetical protein n=1 Tax=Leptospira interrogans TaxID=173 RepID=UPI0002BC5EC3|nr:hypothetical protein [Leptospira interrogans]EMN92989.1 hypothetical protein LEP1GSC110_0250 [Leptospira interrogans serovar Medanensis str. UT053]